MTNKGKEVAEEVVNLEGYKEQLKNLKTADEAMNFLKHLVAPTLQAMLEAEMEVHLGYPKHDSSGDNTGNSRNGYYDKKIRTKVVKKAFFNIERIIGGIYDVYASFRC